MFIYKTTNLINGMIYVGQKRTDCNIGNYKGGGKLLQVALKEFGRKNFIREIIEDGITDIDTLNKREQFWVECLDARNPEVGYNMVDGGGGIPNPPDEVRQKISATFKGKKLSEEQKRKIAPWGRVQKEETKRKISEAQKGEKGNMFGKEHTEEQKEKVSVHLQGKKKIKNTSSKYVGVCWIKSRNRWRATIQYKEKRTHLGFFLSEEEAALVYNKKAIEIYGENAMLNIIGSNHNE